jgi:hypothetical protein
MAMLAAERRPMTRYLAAQCPKCTKWTAVDKIKGDKPATVPSIAIAQIVCGGCGEKYSLLTADLQEIEGSPKEYPPAR